MAARSTAWRWVGDRALLRELPSDDLRLANAAARRLAADLVRLVLPEVEDVVPAARSVLVLLRGGAEPSPALLEALERAGAAPGPDERGAPLHEIAVAYGGQGGPDLGEVARLHGVSEREVVARHSSVTYTVGFLGFSPGFAYLIGLPAPLAAPRLATPRARVPAGSVAIAGEFTAVYPQATPGGWRILGHAEEALFDPAADPPARLRPGDRVRFVPR